jgi:heme-degrading monooxygenase HmoA
MLLKWIMCRVSEELRVPFSTSQSKWRQLSQVQGFLGQVGGWDLKAKDEACILAMWQDESHYKQFMKLHHDKIVRHNHQMNTYESIDVSLLTPTYDMPGCRDSMMESLQEACALRIADCFVKPDREAHFAQMQKEVWIPNMCKAEGMLAGVFSKVEQDQSHYMVTSLWSSLESHNQYAEKLVPTLRECADVNEDLEMIAGRLVPLDRDWLVLPSKSVQMQK